MKDRLPIMLEHNELPIDEINQMNKKNDSYGYVSFLYLASVLITIGSVLVVILLGK